MMRELKKHQKKPRKKNPPQKTAIYKEEGMKKPIFSINIICKENRGEAVSQRLPFLLGMLSRIFF